MFKRFVNKYNTYILVAVDLVLILGIVNGILEFPKADRLPMMCVIIPLGSFVSFIINCEIKEDDASSRQINQLSREFIRSKKNHNFYDDN